VVVEEVEEAVAGVEAVEEAVEEDQLSRALKVAQTLGPALNVPSSHSLN
jgi:hypothetical protein